MATSIAKVPKKTDPHKGIENYKALLGRYEPEPLHRDQRWDFIGRTDSEAPFWPPDAKRQLIGKDTDAGKDWGQEEKGATENETVGWHYQLNGHEFEQTPEDSERHGSLACCRTWSCKEPDMTEWLNNKTRSKTRKYVERCLNRPLCLLLLHMDHENTQWFRDVSAKAMAPHSSTLAWKIPWTEEPDRLQSMGSLRVRHDWATSLSLFTSMHWRRKWQPTPVFLPGESQGRRSLVGCRLWGHTESDTTEAT